MKLTLHVGLPKTATTTIQHVLEASKPALAARGVLYPGTTAGQLDLVRRAQFDRSGSSTAEGSIGAAVERLSAEIREQRPEQVVLSCEHMSLVPARALMRLKQVLLERLPEVRDIGVLCYLREPVGFATSLCQQRLKAGTTRLAEFAAAPWPFSLRDILSKHTACFGRDAVEVRHFHPARMVNGNVVDDFLSAIGLLGFPLEVPVPVLNPSLTQAGALVADALAELVPRDQRHGGYKPVYKRMLEAVEGPRFVLPTAVQLRIIAEARSDLEFIRREFGLEILPEPVAHEIPPGLDAAAARNLAQGIVETARRQVAANRGPS